MNEFVQLAQAVGFPIACVIACGFFIYKMVIRDRDEAKDRELRAEKREESLVEANVKNSQALEKVADTIASSDMVNKELSETNRLLVEKVEDNMVKLQADVEKINSNLEVVVDNIKK